MLIAQDKVHVDIYRRSSDDSWEIEDLSYGDTVRLDSAKFTTPIETFYEDVIGNLK